MTAVMWFRRDLPLGDDPALVEAVAGGAVLPLFVIDPAQWGPAGISRRLYLGDSLPTAGCGTDPAPYFRVFNPVTQGRTFDGEGAYVRPWLPELADATDPHEPVDPIVDHAVERREALERWERIHG